MIFEVTFENMKIFQKVAFHCIFIMRMPLSLTQSAGTFRHIIIDKKKKGDSSF
jgi:hypothetical protein